VPELRAFIGYVAHGDGDRWDSHHPGLIRDIAEKPIRPSTIKTYHSYLASFFAWMTAEGFLTISPMKRVVAPIDREKNKVVPFSAKQAEQLLCASTTGPFPLRDEAIVLFLLDTGVRASELVSIKMEDLDRSNKTASVLGKGNKRRIVRYGLETSRALWRYICTRLDGLEPKAPLFVSCNGHRSGSALTADGLADIIERLGDAAEIHGVRCSPHTLRHTFAVSRSKCSLGTAT
jgi:site-specific recombinase XerD